MFVRTLLVLVALTGITRADTRGTLRFGVVPLELRSSSDTPLFGERVDRVVTEYNAAAAAYDRTHGGMTARIDAGDLGVAETLLVLSPGFEIGSGAYFFRLEAPLGLADNLKSYGLGVYPINLQVAPRRSFVLYASGGGTASYLDRPGSGDIGGLVALRAAVGCRFASHLVLEVGYSAFAIGGTINSDRLASMMNGDMTQLAQPQEVISAGEARGLLDASLGVTF